MPNARCWVCGRDESEVRRAVNGKTDAELEVEMALATARSAKTEYRRHQAAWMKAGDEKFYGPFKMLQKAGRDRGAGIAHLGDVTVSGRTGKERDYLDEKLAGFEKLTGTSLYWDSPDSGFSDTPDYVLRDKTAEKRVKIAKMAADLVFSIQLKILKDRLANAKAARPVRKIRPVKLNEVAKRVPLCDICSELMSELHPVEEDDWDFDDDGGGHRGDDEGYAEDYSDSDSRD